MTTFILALFLIAIVGCFVVFVCDDQPLALLFGGLLSVLFFLFIVYFADYTF